MCEITQKFFVKPTNKNFVAIVPAIKKISGMLNISLCRYDCILGELLLAAQDCALCGLWIADEKHYPCKLKGLPEKNSKILSLSKKWLDIYFSGKEPNFKVPIKMSGTQFQLKVWKLLQKIPYGKTTTYGRLAEEIAKECGIKMMSAQAVGNAVGKNNISIIVPCHRVMGANCNLTGYAGGLENKIKLLKTEHIDTTHFTMPKKARK